MSKNPHAAEIRRLKAEVSRLEKQLASDKRWDQHYGFRSSLTDLINKNPLTSQQSALDLRTEPMPGTHLPEKEPLGLQVYRELKYRLRKEAKRQRVDVSVMVGDLLDNHFGHVKLTPEEMKIIEEATKLARRTRRRIATPFFS